MSRFVGVCGFLMIDEILSPTFAGRVDTCLRMEVDPQGMFANWNPRVSRDAFTRQE